jgi:hypothetical protein
MCDWCHALKTALEATARAKTSAIKKRHIGIKSEPKMKVSRKFDGTIRRWTREHGWKDVT